MTTLLIALFISALIIAAWIIVEIGKCNTENYNDYELQYEKIKNLINDCDINEITFKYILKRLKLLSQMKHKNSEKTTILTVEFFQRFKAEAKKQVLKD